MDSHVQRRELANGDPNQTKLHSNLLALSFAVAQCEEDKRSDPTRCASCGRHVGLERSGMHGGAYCAACWTVLAAAHAHGAAAVTDSSGARLAPVPAPAVQALPMFTGASEGTDTAARAQNSSHASPQVVVRGAVQAIAVPTLLETAAAAHAIGAAAAQQKGDQANGKGTACGELSEAHIRIAQLETSLRRMKVQLEMCSSPSNLEQRVDSRGLSLGLQTAMLEGLRNGSSSGEPVVRLASPLLRPAVDRSLLGLSSLHAKELVCMSLDAMALITGTQITWSNPAFCEVAQILGNGDVGHGIALLQAHFVSTTERPTPDAAVQYSEQELKGATCVITTKCGVKCFSTVSSSVYDYLWVLSSHRKEVCSAAGMVESDSKLADPLLKILPFNNKRKRLKGDSEDSLTTSLDSQNLWQKYGCKTVSTMTESVPACKVQAKRSYYKCYTKDCLARLTVDTSPESGAQLKVASSGIHNHPITLEPVACALTTHFIEYL